MTAPDRPEETPPAVTAASGTATAERMHPFSPLVRTWLFLLAGGYFLVTMLIQNDIPWQDITQVGQAVGQALSEAPVWLLVAFGAIALSIGSGYWGWWTTKLVMDNQELRVENTGAFQESKRIAYSRIQSVDLKQPLAARVLGLAELSIEVGADQPTRLAFLARKRAAAIRDYLMARAHKQHVTTQDTQRTASAWDDTGQGDETLVRLHPGQIILGGLLSSELPMLLLFFLVPLGLSIWFQQPMIAVGGGLIPLTLALGGFLSKRVLTQFNYTLARTPAGLRITRGLTTLNSQTIPAHRVQSVTISQPLFWRPMKRAKLTLTVLGGLVAETQGESTLYLPIGDARQIQIALAALWPNLRLQDLRFTRTPRRARWLSPLSWSWLGYATDAEVLAVRRGWFERKQTIIPHARLQSMQIHQGPFERRLKLATVVSYCASMLDRTEIKHLELGQARRLAFDEMDAARAARSQELTRAPASLGWQLTAAAASATQADLWTPDTAMGPRPGSDPAVSADTAPTPKESR